MRAPLSCTKLNWVRLQVTDGSIEFAVNKVDGSTGEFSGVFVSEQLSDTDMGSKAPKKVRSLFYPSTWPFVAHVSEFQ